MDICRRNRRTNLFIFCIYLFWLHSCPPCRVTYFGYERFQHVSIQEIREEYV